MANLKSHKYVYTNGPCLTQPQYTVIHEIPNNILFLDLNVIFASYTLH